MWLLVLVDSPLSGSPHFRRWACRLAGGEGMRARRSRVCAACDCQVRQVSVSECQHVRAGMLRNQCMLIFLVLVHLIDSKSSTVDSKWTILFPDLQEPAYGIWEQV